MTYACLLKQYFAVMGIQLCTFVVVSVLMGTGLVTGETYHMSAVILDIPENSTCSSNSQREAVRTNNSNNIKDILVEIAANNTVIPECGGSGWRLVAFLDMTDPNQICPQSWRLYDQDSVRACGRQISSGVSCDSVQYSPNGYEFAQVCGRITGYQYGSPDGLGTPSTDGVSVTYGLPRHHIWTLYAGVREGFRGCCDSSPHVASQVGENYFCDTGNPGDTAWTNTLFNDHPLWDGIAGCPSSTITCCAPHSGPWFHVILTNATTDSIEIRICGDEPTSNEDTPLELIKIYVK